MNKLTLALIAVAFLAPAVLPAAASTTDALPTNHRATTTRGPANEVWTAVNPKDSNNVVVVAKDYHDSGSFAACAVHNVWMGIYTTKDGGATWTNIAPPRTGALANWPCSSDPIVWTDPSGTFYFEGLALGSNTACWTATSHDGGLTIDSVSVAATGSSLDKEDGATDPTTGVVYNTYVDIGGGGSIKIVAGIPLPTGGLQWLKPVAVGGSGTSPAVLVLPGGLVEVTWISGSQIDYAISAPLAQKFVKNGVAANAAPFGGISGVSFRTVTLPNSAVDVNTGTVYITWADAGSGVEGDILLTHSSANGQAPWSTPVRVNQDTIQHDHVMSNVAVSPDGSHIFVGYYDRRDDPNNVLITPYLSESTDGGAHWADHRVGEVLYNGDIGFHQNGFPFIGDYLGVAATNAGAYIGWADTRDHSFTNPGSEVYEAFLPN
ncbi:MAG: hypothetical protein ACYDCK_07085 [Thermoplasmatota archaeon]